MEESSFLQNLVTAWDALDPEAEDPYPDVTNSPPLNSLIRAARMFLDDRTTPSDLFEELRIMTVRLEGAIRAYPPEAQPEISEALDQVRQSVLDMAQYFTDREEDHVHVAIDRLQEAAKVLEARGVDLDELPEGVEERLSCGVCGELSEFAPASCARCGCQVPVPAASDPTGLSRVPPEVLSLAAAGEQVVAGTGTLDEWGMLIIYLMEGVHRARMEALHLARAVQPNASEGLMDLGNSLVSNLDEAARILDIMGQWDGTPGSIAREWADLVPALARARKSGEVFWESASALAPRSPSDPSY